MKIKAYKIVTGKDEATLAGEVNRLMADGWQPSGSPSQVRQPYAFALVQAMVLPDDGAPVVPVADSPINERP